MSSYNRDKRKEPNEPEPGAAFSPEQERIEISDPSEETGEGGSSATGETAESTSEQVRKLQAEKQELTNMLVRRQADFENYRKRVEKERHQDRHRGVETLVESVLPVLDAFDRALEKADDSASAEYLKGFELIRRQLSDLLAKQGLKRIEAVGKEFNPHFHHAIEQVETSQHADGTVIAEMQPGYVFHERVLRPAMVRVASHRGEKAVPASRKEN